MVVRPRGHVWPSICKTAATIVALLFVAPAFAAGTAATSHPLDRMTFAADPLTEAFGARPVMPLDVGHTTRWNDVLRRQEASLTTATPCADPSADRASRPSGPRLSLN